ncbi:WYL domain-containing protein [Endozoicomonas sp. G2_2]|uniref:WYL domain-containing protein n=1 Tax=Endozoicomonas sp. G2_2 TaxID=2821092 RepID=UPI001ADAB785|nr:WYL domain-containing protein [Endozoicomonas sp. G2_2]MBO9471649.1 WYL domain-containing protein [Endozoicomonas sp. G2_2]
MEAKHSSGSNMRWSVERRLEFIEFRLYWEGRINRSDVMSLFGISAPQASADLKRYQELAPDNMHYSGTRKCYLANPDFSPVISRANAHEYLARLRLLGEGLHGNDESWLGAVPAFDSVRPPTRQVEPQKLRRVLDAIQGRQAMEIRYQSMSRPEPIWRWINPHALAFDGFRWHTRAWCQLRQQFQDFVFARMLDIGDLAAVEGDIPQDLQWQRFIVMRIGPHPELQPSARRAIELDYGMTSGEMAIRTRLALSYYLERQLGLDFEAPKVSPQRQQVVLLNREEIDEARNTF